MSGSWIFTKKILALMSLLSFMVSILATIYIISDSSPKTGRDTSHHQKNEPYRSPHQKNEPYASPHQKNESYLEKKITTEYPTRRSLLLFVGIVSAPLRIDRRSAVRETWMKECRMNPDAVCRFFTDGQDAKGQALQGEKIIKLENESRVYEDILLAEAPGGVNFAVKYLWMLEWANKTYDFQYFLRIDDDYFICFRKLMLELESPRPREKLQWGWLHCWNKVATWLDEGFYLVTKDIVESFLSRRDTLVCNIWESQSIGYWLKNVSNLMTFGDNRRLLHQGLGTNVDKRTEICHSFLAIHQSYPQKMRMYWSIYEKEPKATAYSVPAVSYHCKHQVAMDIMAWRGDKFWFCDLKLCKDNPIWNPDRKYIGREGI